MASRLFFAAVLGLLQLSFGTPSPWTARLLSTEGVNGTNETDSVPTTTTTSTTTTVLFYHQVIGTMTLDVEDPEGFVNDPDSKVAIAKSLAATLAGVEEDMINVTLELKDKDARRLAAGRALQAENKSVVVTYVITLSGSDASDAATLGDNLVQSILNISTEDMKSSLTQAFTDAGLNVVLGDIVIDAPSSQAVVVDPSPDPSPTPSSPSPPSPSPPSPSPPSPSPSPSGGKQDEEDGSVMQSQAYVFMLLGLLTTLVHA